MARLVLLLIVFCACAAGPARAENTDEKIRKAVLAFHNGVARKISEWNCSWDVDDLDGTDVTKLTGPGKQQVFVVPVLCFSHQSNASTIFYQVTRGDDGWDVAPMSFAFSYDGKEIISTVPLANGEFSGENTVIQSTVSGYGDYRDSCGTQLKYKWNGYQFALATVRYQACCGSRGEGAWCAKDSEVEPPGDDFPLVFSRKVKVAK